MKINKGIRNTQQVEQIAKIISHTGSFLLRLHYTSLNYKALVEVHKS